MKYHENNMKNAECDISFIDHNGNIATRMDVKDTVRLYCLTKQSHEESQINFMTLIKRLTFSRIGYYPT